MKAQINNHSPIILETLSREFNDHNIYGLEYILDEFNNHTEANKSINNEPAHTDWFGFSDLCI